MEEEVELPNQVNRMLGEKETYKYLGIFEADTIKQQKMQEKDFLSEFQKRQNIVWDKTLWQEPCQRGKYLGSPPPGKILETILEVDQRRT